MTDDYGRKVGQAFLAIHQLYLDTSRLLQDCDGTIGKGKALATKSANAIVGLSYSLGKQWMAYAAYRCYAADPDGCPGAVDAVCIWFYDLQKRIEEAHLLVGHTLLQLEDGQKLQDVCQGLELLAAVREVKERSWGAVLEGGPLPEGWGCGPVERFRLIGVPLFSIRSIQDVENLMGRVKNPERPTEMITENQS